MPNARGRPESTGRPEAAIAVVESGAGKIVMDLSGLKYIDSSGIGELVSCYTTITNRGGQLRLTNLHNKILSLLQLTALVSVFQIMDSNGARVADIFPTPSDTIS